MTPLEVHSYDWSGAGSHSERKRGIVLCHGCPGSVPAIKSGWSRHQVFQNLCTLASEASTTGRILVGMDCAFSFPFGAKGGRFPDGSASRAEFWKVVHASVWSQDAQAYVDAFRGHFLWYDQIAGRQHTGCDYRDARRDADLAAAKAGAHANTVFKLVGSNQVGKGSLCGIALLEALRLHCKQQKIPLAVWPFFLQTASGEVQALPRLSPSECAPERCLVVVETYPSLHWAMAGSPGKRPWDAPASWPKVRTRFNANVAHVQPNSGDEGDALIAW